MKKILCLILAAALIFSLSGCRALELALSRAAEAILEKNSFRLDICGEIEEGGDMKSLSINCAAEMKPLRLSGSGVITGEDSETPFMFYAEGSEEGLLLALREGPEDSWRVRVDSESVPSELFELRGAGLLAVRTFISGMIIDGKLLGSGKLKGRDCSIYAALLGPEEQPIPAYIAFDTENNLPLYIEIPPLEERLELMEKMKCGAETELSGGRIRIEFSGFDEQTIERPDFD